jgi:hypothetical protein
MDDSGEGFRRKKPEGDAERGKSWNVQQFELSMDARRCPNPLNWMAHVKPVIRAWLQGSNWG